MCNVPKKWFCENCKSNIYKYLHSINLTKSGTNHSGTGIVFADFLWFFLFSASFMQNLFFPSQQLFSFSDENAVLVNAACIVKSKELLLRE